VLKYIKEAVTYWIDEFHPVSFFDPVALEGVLLLLNLRARVQVFDGDPKEATASKMSYRHKASTPHLQL
jgi:hypothetical protein